MDFFSVGVQEGKKDEPPTIFADFKVGRSKDLMVRGRSFYAIWDEKAGLWSTDEYDVQRLVDEELYAYRDAERAKGNEYRVKSLQSFGSNSWSTFRKYVQNISDNSHQLDENLTFSNSETKKGDYVSRCLPYPLEPGDRSAWDEIVGTLYSEEERAKIEWAIGAIVAGDAKRIQKFVVLYGPPGKGKGTILNIVGKLFEGYTTTFEAKALGSSNGSFATEVFKDNPLVAIQHDGDLSKIEDNTRLNSIISHEEMTMNEKYKPSYTSKVNAFLFMGTNQPVKISDAKSGIIRRLIDVHPSGEQLSPNHYMTLMSRIDFELGAIAHHCLEVYRTMGKNFYNAYRPLEMMYQTDVFFNFIEASYDIFKAQDGATLRQAYTLYKEYCADSGIERPIPQYKVREELRNYFDHFQDRAVVDGANVRSYYSGFNANKFKAPVNDDIAAFSLVLEEKTSLFDLELAEQPAQLSRIDEFGKATPAQRWANVKTTLADVDTSELHFVKVPDNHIVIDFDLKDETGQKSLEKNLEAASTWPATYAELSQGGGGVHLHYIYDGDVTELSSQYDDEIEVKTLLGNSSLRRRLTKCNNVPIATISSGLPIKEKKPLLDSRTIQSEKGLRTMIARNLNKEIHPGTKPSIDFIKKILDDAYLSGMIYNVEDLRPKVVAFANNSSNQTITALKTVQMMRWKSDAKETAFTVPQSGPPEPNPTDDRIVFFDVEVYSNLFVVCWKFKDSDDVVKMINPTGQEIETLFGYRLVGFNNRRYDNHILYARYLGYDNEQLYRVSQKIIDKAVGSMFGEAYNLSYADIYDFSSKKQSLKKFGIELGMHHMEMDIPWDKPVPDEYVEKVIEYCTNDVLLTEATFNDRESDFTAREILAELSGLKVNDTTQKHTAKIIFGSNRNPQSSFVYPNLAEEFPGYTFEMGKSSYRGEDPSEGGYVYAEPGMYENVAVLDVVSMHPTSMINLNLFGEYTPKFKDLLDARVAIKRGDFDKASTMLDGRLAPYLKNRAAAKELAYALKIVINTVYGLTSAKFDNPFRDLRNVDNVVAKRGALFMIDLKHFVQEELGIQVIHIKTDSIKVELPRDEDAAKAIVDAITEFGTRYGYEFEHEETYKSFCLTNDAVYIAQKEDGKWEAVGAQFQHPYVYKKLFSGETIEWEDLCETKQVQKGVMYLDFNDVDKPFHSYSGMQHVGRIGRFVPVTPESGGGTLFRVAEVDGEQKKYAVSGTKGFTWLEATVAEANRELIEIDQAYYESLIMDALNALNKFGDAEAFLN